MGVPLFWEFPKEIKRILPCSCLSQKHSLLPQHFSYSHINDNRHALIISRAMTVVILIKNFKKNFNILNFLYIKWFILVFNSFQNKENE